MICCPTPIKLALAILASLLLAGCLEEEKVGLSYHAYNHTDKSIVAIVINDKGGILDAIAHGEGSGVCCVVLPKKWRPGLVATIKWQLDGEWLKDEQGNEVIRDGKTVLVPGPWKERTVEVPKYDSRNGMGDFHMHFLQNHDVKVLVHLYSAGHPSHPYPHPSGLKREL